MDFRHPSSGHSHFYLVRHGRTEGNVRRILVGRTDIPLDTLGYRQAAAVAESLMSMPRPDVIVASPLLRARETARAIADRLGLPVHIEPDLAELNFGSFEGWTFEDIWAQHPEFASKMSDRDFDTAWPGGERLSEFHQRTLAALGGLAARYPAHTSVIVTHGGFLGSVAAQLMGTPPNDWARFQIRNCSITHLEVTTRSSTFHRFNDDAHLDALHAEFNP
jgi:broad specificity phosphatase PhoE